MIPTRRTLAGNPLLAPRLTSLPRANLGRHSDGNERATAARGRYRRGLGLALALGAAVMMGGVVARAQGGDDWHMVGDWRSVASGDDVQALARDGEALLSASASGGVVRWSADRHTIRQYLAPQDGLPSNNVRDLVSWRGTWWVATAEGLAKLNAAQDRFEPVLADLPSSNVTALAVDASDNLWVASSQAWDPVKTFTGKPKPGGWTGGGVAYTRDGTRWISPADNATLPSANVKDLIIWKGTTWIAAEPAQEWVPPSRDADGNPVPGRWQASGGGVGQLSGQRWLNFNSTTNNQLSDNTRVLAADDRALWVGTAGRGLQVFAGGNWKAMQDCGQETRCIQDDFVTSLAVSADGSVWVGTARFNGRGTGVNVLDPRGTPGDPADDAWFVVRPADGLPGGLVQAILPDRDGTVWFGTADIDPEGRHHGKGIARLMGDRETLQTLSTASASPSTLVDNDVTAISRHPVTGELWVGTSRSGLSVRSPNGAWRTYTRSSTAGGLGSDSIADIAIEPSGIVWVATRQTAYDTKKNQWTDGGLSRFDGQTWRRLGTEGGLPTNHLSALVLDGRGKLWVGTGATDIGPKELAFRGAGLAVVDTAKMQWERTYTHPTLTSNNITDLTVVGGQLWAATSYFFYVDTRPGGAQLSIGGGLSVYDLGTGKWRKLAAPEGLTVGIKSRGGEASGQLLDIRSLYVDPRGTAWAGALGYPDGRFTPDESPDGIVDMIDAAGKVTNTRFTGAGSVLALVPDGDGNIWAASSLDGVRVFAGGNWIRQAARRGGLPSDNLSDLSFEGNEVWLATRGNGLIRLVPPPPPTAPTPLPGTPAPTPDPGTGAAKGILRRFTYRILLPITRNDIPPRIVPVPGW